MTKAVYFAEEADRMERGIRAIMDALCNGHVCDDVAWLDDFTTLFDHCAMVLGDRMSQEEYEAIRDGYQPALHPNPS